MTTLWIDYESASECDLPARGVFNYARDPSTRMLCAAYAFDDEDVELWWGYEPVPLRLAAYFKSGGQIRAHNEEFDRLLTWYVVCPDYGLSEPALDRWYCTAAQARANCAPGSLEDVGRFFGASMKKDHRGAALVRKCCIPPFKNTHQDLIDLGEYAKQDVRAMRAISNAIRQLSNDELTDYHVNARINMRGVLVDVALARGAVKYAAQEVKDIQEIVVEVTHGEVPTVRSPKMRDWVFERLDEDGQKLMMVEGKKSIDKTVRANLLTTDLDSDVREVIQSADDLWASSVAKFQRMADLADVEDQRVRGAFVFAGGSATGRASSYGLQVHNFGRKCHKEPEAVRAAIVEGRSVVPEFGTRTTDVLKTMLRPALRGPFTVADWSAIEARLTPWLSTEGDEVLDVFRAGGDIYVNEAQKIFNVLDVTPEQRQIGKVAILACGFGGGHNAFAAMGRAYNVKMSEAQARQTVEAWRRANPWAVRYWSNLEWAYNAAMRNPGKHIKAARVSYCFNGQHLWYALPSGRILCYPFARLEDDGITYAKAAWKPAQDAKEWPRARLWKGLACENITQAVANDLLRHACRVLDSEGYAIVLTVHDEIVIEHRDAEATLRRLNEVMCSPPDWCKDLPLVAECKQMERYSK
jgi:DNA polymerase